MFLLLCFLTHILFTQFETQSFKKPLNAPECTEVIIDLGVKESKSIVKGQRKEEDADKRKNQVADQERIKQLTQ